MKLVVSLSGGMDSSTMAYKLRSEGHDLKALTFDYGQRHKKEIECAANIAENLGIEHQVIDVSFLADLLPGSSLTDKNVDVPHGHYEEESMKATVVPNRNMIFTSILSAHALAIGYDGIALGIHAGDHAIYPDCRAEWLESVLKTVCIGNWGAEKFVITTPFIDVTKVEILQEGIRLGVPYEDTWTCYEGGEKANSRTSSSGERLEAFAENKISDPLEYQDLEHAKTINPYQNT